MAEIVNLRRARKAKAHAESEATAAENRIRFGRSKQERVADAANEVKRVGRLDQHRREPSRDGE